MYDFGRLMTAMVTPFDQQGRVDYQQVRALASYLVDNGSDTIVVAGTTGESPTLTKEEKLQLFETVRDEVSTRAKVVAGTGSNNTATSIELTQAAEKCGLDGIMLVAPYYNKPSQEGLYQHFVAIAKSTTLPIMLYNIPGRAGINMLPQLMVRLAQIENIVAVKEAAGSLDQVTELIRLLPESVAVYSGDDSLTLPILAVGGRGVVSVASHVAGPQIKEMITAYLAGEVKKAQAIFLKLYPLFKNLFITSNPVPVKTALNLKGLPVGSVRLPLVAANDEEVLIIRQTLEELDLI